MKFSENQIIEVLRRVVHPASGKDIVSLNMVREVKTEDGKIGLTLYFRNFNDPLKNLVQKSCKRLLLEHLDKNLEIDIGLQSDTQPAEKKEKPLLPGVRNVIAIASGKGGVGKSTVAVNLAVAFANTGAKVGLIDADIFGPSIPKMLGLENEKPTVRKEQDKDLLIPLVHLGIKVLSIGFFLNPADATIWRGPMASGAFQQLLGEADWGELDYLFVDLPPGTSDIHLTLVQQVSVTGAVIVSTPQDVALADVIKGISMFRNNNIKVPVLGLIENMAWFTPEELPDNKYYIFGKDGCKKLAAEYGIPLLGQIPIVQAVREGGDNGKPVILQKNSASEAFKSIADRLILEIIKRNASLQPTRKVDITEHRKL